MLPVARCESDRGTPRAAIRERPDLGIFFSDLPARNLAAWSNGRFEILATVDILIEYRRSLNGSLVSALGHVMQDLGEHCGSAKQVSIWVSIILGLQTP